VPPLSVPRASPPPTAPPSNFPPVFSHRRAAGEVSPTPSPYSSRPSTSPRDEFDAADQASGFAIVARTPSTFPSLTRTTGGSPSTSSSAAFAGVELAGESCFSPFLSCPSDRDPTVQNRWPNPNRYRPVPCCHVAEPVSPSQIESKSI
jgi:hypothetical protein